MKHKMIWKLAACFAAVLLLFTLVLGAVFVFMFRQHTISINRTAMEEKAVSIANSLSAFETGNGGSGMGRRGMGGYGAYLRFLDQLAMAEVWIVDENLELLTTGHGSQTRYSEFPNNAEQIVERVFAGELTYGEDFSSLLDSPTLTVGAPIMNGGKVVGAVLLHSPVSGVETAVHQGLSALIWGAVTALILAGIAAVWLSYRFTKPLSQMKVAAQKLSEGDYGADTGVEQDDEIGQLARTIDGLAGRLFAAEQERAALDKLKQDFVANVSHELRTPVAVLRGFVEILQDGTVSDPLEKKDCLDQMMAESRHLERLVNDLLDLSRLQDSQFQLEFKEINLCDVVRDGVRSVRRLAQEKDVEIMAQYPEQECIVTGDYVRLRQLLLIFLDNAIKFSQPQETVDLSLSPEPSGYLLKVSNKGKTIPPEELSHLFDRFYKANSVENRSGTGLGLAIAKQIIERHKADILVESHNGTIRFIIHLYDHPLE